MTLTPTTGDLPVPPALVAHAPSVYAPTFEATNWPSATTVFAEANGFTVNGTPFTQQPTAVTGLSASTAEIVTGTDVPPVQNVNPCPAVGEVMVTSGGVVSNTTGSLTVTVSVALELPQPSTNRSNGLDGVHVVTRRGVSAGHHAHRGRVLSPSA